MRREETLKRVRIVKVNLFLQNNGIILKNNFLVFFILTFQSILFFLIFLDYNLYSSTNKTIIENFYNRGNEIFVLQRFFILTYIDNSIISTANDYIQLFQLPQFSDFIKYKDFKISVLGYFEFFISFILTILTFIFSIVQTRDQTKYATIGLFSIYSPIFLIILSLINKNKYHYFKRIAGVKRDTFTVDKRKSFIEIFFNKSETYLNNNIDDLELRIETKSEFLGFYNYYRVSILKKEKKK